MVASKRSRMEAGKVTSSYALLSGKGEEKRLLLPGRRGWLYEREFELTGAPVLFFPKADEQRRHSIGQPRELVDARVPRPAERSVGALAAMVHVEIGARSGDQAGVPVTSEDGVAASSEAGLGIAAGVVATPAEPACPRALTPTRATDGLLLRAAHPLRGTLQLLDPVGQRLLFGVQGA